MSEFGGNFAVFAEDDTPEVIESKRLLQMQKDIHLNLREEYTQHLKQMSLLKNFKDLKLNWDHSFFKSIIAPKVPNNKPTVKGIEEYGTDLHTMAENLI